MSLGKFYTTKELEELLVEFNLDTPLSVIATNHNRPVYSISQKIQDLYKQDPNRWNPEKAKKYVKEGSKSYYSAHSDMIKKLIKLYRQQHKDKVRTWVKEYRKRNKGKWRIFGEYLKSLLNRCKGTKVEAAKELGINATMLSDVLSGNKRPSKKLLRNIPMVFDVPHQQPQILFDLIKTDMDYYLYNLELYFI